VVYDSFGHIIDLTYFLKAFKAIKDCLAIFFIECDREYDKDKTGHYVMPTDYES